MGNVVTARVKESGEKELERERKKGKGYETHYTLWYHA
jgi:hypothetical protein